MCAVCDYSPYNYNDVLFNHLLLSFQGLDTQCAVRYWHKYASMISILIGLDSSFFPIYFQAYFCWFIGSGNSLAQNWWQDIIWSSDWKSINSNTHKTIFNGNCHLTGMLPITKMPLNS